MEEILLKDDKNQEIKNNENSFDKLCKIQKLIKKDSSLRELCKK